MKTPTPSVSSATGDVRDAGTVKVVVENTGSESRVVVVAPTPASDKFGIMGGAEVNEVADVTCLGLGGAPAVSRGGRSESPDSHPALLDSSVLLRRLSCAASSDCLSSSVSPPAGRVPSDQASGPGSEDKLSPVTSRQRAIPQSR